MRSLKSPPSHGVWGSNHPLVLQLKGKVCLACSSMFYKQKPYLVGFLFCIGCISASKSRTPDVPQAWMNLYYQYYNNLKHKLQKSLFIWVACFIKTDVTPFFPGIAHSQFMRFMVPSAFFVGTATNPWNQGRRFCKQGVKDHILTIYQELRVQSPPGGFGQCWMLLTKGWSFLHALRSWVSRLNAMPDMTCGLLQTKTTSWNSAHPPIGGRTLRYNLVEPWQGSSLLTYLNERSTRLHSFLNKR